MGKILLENTYCELLKIQLPAYEQETRNHTTEAPVMQTATNVQDMALDMETVDTSLEWLACLLDKAPELVAEQLHRDQKSYFLARLKDLRPSIRQMHRLSMALEAYWYSYSRVLVLKSGFSRQVNEQVLELVSNCSRREGLTAAALQIDCASKTFFETGSERVASI